MTSDKKTAKAPSDLFLPLAAGVNPDLIEGLGKLFRVSQGDFIGGGEYVSESHEEVVQLGDLPKDEFMEWAAAATGTMRSVAAQMEEQQQTVKVQEGASNDERIERIRGQIAQSKKWQTE